MSINEEDTTEETTVEEVPEVEPEIPQVDENFRPVADPENHEGEVFDYSPRADPEDFVPGPDSPAEADFQPEIPNGEHPVPAETVDPDEVEEGEVIEGTTLAPGLIDAEEQEKRKEAEAEKVERDAKNAVAVLEANTVAVAPEEDPNEGLPAETVKPEELPAEEDVDPSDDEEFEAERAAATDKVPTQASNKQEIRNYLIYEHGVDPDDLQDQTKSELLDLVRDLAE